MLLGCKWFPKNKQNMFFYWQDLSLFGSQPPICRNRSPFDTDKERIKNFWTQPSLLRVAMVSCFNSTWTEPGAQPLAQPAARIHPSATAPQSPQTSTSGPQSRLSSATCLHLPITMTTFTSQVFAGVPELPPGLRGRHQPPAQPGALNFLHVPVHVLLLWPQWCGFGELRQKFSPPLSWREGTCWETDEAAEPRRWLHLPSGYQDTTWGLDLRTGRMGGMQWSVHHTWNKCDSFTAGLPKLATERKNDLICVTSLRLTTWMQEKSIKGVADHINNWRGLGVWVLCGRAPLWQAHTGRQYQEQSLQLPAHGHGGTCLSPKPHLHSRAPFPFYNLYQITQLCLSFVPFLQVIWYPPQKRRRISRLRCHTCRLLVQMLATSSSQ